MEEAQACDAYATPCNRKQGIPVRIDIVAKVYMQTLDESKKAMIRPSRSLLGMLLLDVDFSKRCSCSRHCEGLRSRGMGGHRASGKHGDRY
jgi:hypothetical protein